MNNAKLVGSATVVGVPLVFTVDGLLSGTTKKVLDTLIRHIADRKQWDHSYFRNYVYGSLADGIWKRNAAILGEGLRESIKKHKI